MLTGIYIGLDNLSLNNYFHSLGKDIYNILDPNYYWSGTSQSFQYNNSSYKLVSKDDQDHITQLMGSINIEIDIPNAKWKYKYTNGFNAIEKIDEPLYISQLPPHARKFLRLIEFLFTHKGSIIKYPEIGIHSAYFPLLHPLLQDNCYLVYINHPDIMDMFTTELDKVYVVENSGIKLISQEYVKPKLNEEWELGDLFRVGDPSVGGWPF